MSLFKKLNKIITDGLFASPTPITASNPAASQADITPINNIFTRTKTPTGIVNTSEISFSASGRTITVASSSSLLKCYFCGIYYEIACPDSSIEIPNTANRGNFIYVNSSGVLAQTTTFDMSILGQLPTLCYAYWNGTEVFISPILRSVYMDGGTWARFMSLDDVSWEYGADLTADDSALSISEGSFWMGDINEITPITTSVYYYYRDGSKWMRTTAGTLIYYLDTNLKYDNAGTLTSAGADEYVAYWVFKSMDKDTPFIVICGQRTDTTLNAARANNSFDTLNLGTYPISGLKPLYRVIAKNNATPYVESLDLRPFINITNASYLTDDIRKALTASSSPSVTNPFATINDSRFRYEKITVGTDATTISTNNIPAGATIYKMHINITTAYPAGSTMQIGKTGTLDYIIGTSLVDITTIQLETYSSELDWSSSEKIYVTIGGSPASGASTVCVWYYV